MKYLQVGTLIWWGMVAVAGAGAAYWLGPWAFVGFWLAIALIVHRERRRDSDRKWQEALLRSVRSHYERPE